MKNDVPCSFNKVLPPPFALRHTKFRKWTFEESSKRKSCESEIIKTPEIHNFIKMKQNHYL